MVKPQLESLDQVFFTTMSVTEPLHDQRFLTARLTLRHTWLQRTMVGIYPTMKRFYLFHLEREVCFTQLILTEILVLNIA